MEDNQNKKEKINESKNKEGKEKREYILQEGSIKIIFLGEVGVGKTSLMKAYLDKDFDPSEISTNVPQIVNDNINSTEYKSFNIVFWDTAGQEKYRSITSKFYRDSQIVIFVYSIIEKKTFEEIKKYWYNSIKDYIGKDVILGLAANKVDLFDKEKVSKKEGIEYAEEIGAIFRETSAKNSRKAFKEFINELIEKLLQNKNLNQKEEKIILKKPTKIKKKCCFI
jgi:small GTP-binding protein